MTRTVVAALLLCLLGSDAFVPRHPAFLIQASFKASSSTQLHATLKKTKNPKVVLITGASSGMGKDAAQMLIERGHIVYGGARRVEPMQESLVPLGGHALKLDVTQEEDIVSCVDTIIREQGKIDVLVNNAGYAIYGAVEDITMDEARKQFDVNIFGVARLTKEVLPHMRAAQQGTIVNFSSMGGKIYTPFGAWYHATKHAMEGFSDCLRVELKPFNINVAIVEPGVIKTSFFEVMFQPMIERSKGGAYEPYIDKFASSDMESGGSDPSVISKVVLKAVEAKKPKRRYLKGYLARPLIWIRTFLGEGVLDYMWHQSITP